MWRCDANYLDGVTALRHAVRVELEAARLRIVSQEDGERSVLDSWSVASLRRVDGMETKGPLRLKPNDTGNARLIIDDPDFASALLGMAPHLRGRSAVRRWVVGLVIAAAGVLASALVVIGAPYLSSWIAPLVPVSWERKLGDKVSGLLLDAYGGKARYCQGKAGQQALRTLRGRLTKAADSAYDIRIRVTSHDQINALALPGGDIVVFNGLIAFAQSPDEVAGVIAHEIGHQVRRHPTQAMIRSMGVDLVVGLVTGGAALGSLGQSMLRLSYSRDAEREADQTASAILAGAGIDGGGIARFLRRLNEKQGSLPAGLQFLSMHPSLESRAADLGNGGVGGDTRPALSPAAWRALRDICVENK